MEDTVLDLVDGCDRLDDVLGWITRACGRRRTTPDRLAAAFGHRTEIRWRAELVGILADVADGCQSPLEIAYLCNVERSHGLPESRRQQHPHVGAATQGVDVWYGLYRLIVELDGRIGHFDDGRFKDHARDNSSTVDGHCDTLRYGSAADYQAD